MSRRATFRLCDVRAALGGFDGSYDSGGRLASFVRAHERRVDHEGRNARVDKLVNHVCGVETHGVVEVAAAKAIGYHGETIAFAVKQRVRVRASLALRTLLVACALAHEQAVLAGHEFLVATNHNAQFDGRIFAELGDLLQGKLRGKPYAASSQGSCDGKRGGICDGQVRPHFNKRAHVRAAHKLAEVFDEQRFFGFRPLPQVDVFFAVHG